MPTILKLTKIPDFLDLSLGEVFVANPLTDHAWAPAPPFPFPRRSVMGGVSLCIYIYIYLCVCVSACVCVSVCLCVCVFAGVYLYVRTHALWRETGTQTDRPLSASGLQELIGRLLVPDPARRLSAEEVLADPWATWNEGLGSLGPRLERGSGPSLWLLRSRACGHVEVRMLVLEAVGL